MRLALLAAIALPLLAGIPESKPEQVGLSSERLRRIHETVQRHIDEHNISGAVTLVARKGHIAHFQAHGLMDVEARTPMAKNTVFRIWSMSKPVAGTAILMLIEEGKVRLNDPVSKSIPEFKEMKVAMAQERPAGLAANAAAPMFTTVPASREINFRTC